MVSHPQQTQTALPTASAPAPPIVDQVRAEVRRAYRLYLVGVALVSLLVGGLIGAYGLGTRDADVPVGITPLAHWQGAACPPCDTPAAALATETPRNLLQVYVSGAVVTSQVVTVPVGSVVADAVAAAGGARGDADLDALNLAAPLADYQHVLVPAPDPGGTGGFTRPGETGGDGEGEAVPVDALININTASADEAQTLPQVGAVWAADIIAHREAHGPFQQIDDIQAVPGIGPAIFERLAPLITVAP